MNFRMKNRFLIIMEKLPFGKYHQCNFCNTKIRNFLPYRSGWRNQPPLMVLLNVIGSDVDNFSCPKCGAHDRERHLRMFMDKLEITKKLQGSSILHFAPEFFLSKYIYEQNPVYYIKADLFPASQDIEKIDITNISYEENSFDFVIANHILEHVFDLTKALSEIHRVLKIGGYAILQTPYSAQTSHTIEDDGIDTDALRLQLYGQEDHVRLFGKDIFKLISDAGFISNIATHQDALAEKNSEYWGVNFLEPFFLFKKKNIR